MKQVLYHAACPCFMSISISLLHIHVHGACPCPWYMSISMVHVHCTMYMLPVHVYMAFHRYIHQRVLTLKCIWRQTMVHTPVYSSPGSLNSLPMHKPWSQLRILICLLGPSCFRNKPKMENLATLSH
jgi:hypothetical protein